MKILFSRWMQELDAAAIGAIGIPSIVLMENASRGAANCFAREFPVGRYRNVIVVAGKGNNGGDGLAIGRILHGKGYDVHFIMLCPPETLNADPAINFNILNNLHLPYTVLDKEKKETAHAPLAEMTAILDRYRPQETFLVDAVFGTGLNKPVKDGFYAAVLETINQSPLDVAAVDIPSGLSDSFLPAGGVHLTARVTATFHALKTAHLYPDGNKYCGHIEIIDIGIPRHLEREYDNESGDGSKYYINLVEPGDFDALLAPGEVDAHKGSYGHVLTVCGSIDKPGAGVLSSHAVLKSGAGLCTAALCKENRTLVVTRHPELMTLVYEKPGDLLKRLGEFSVLLAGPGLGTGPATVETVNLLLEKARVPVVLDADALNVLGNFSGHRSNHAPDRRPFPLILTPHPGEFSRLTGRSAADVTRNRIELARDFARAHRLYLVLKGHHTIIAGPGGRVWVNPTGNPGMATAGSGDVLSGMIAGMTARYYHADGPVGQRLEHILIAAVFLHGYAGDLAVRETGEASLTAPDIAAFIPLAHRKIHEYTTPFPIAR